VTTNSITRRRLLGGGAAAIAGVSVLKVSGPAAAFAGLEDESVSLTSNRGHPPETYPGRPGDEVIRWEDQPAPIPAPAAGVVGNLLEWESLSTRLTPADNFFTVKHYNIPAIDPAAWRLGIDGLVAHPRSLSLADVRSQARKSVEFTLECSGNTGLPFFIGGVGNAVWSGAALAPILRRARPLQSASEVVFWGTDSGTVTIRDDSGVTSAGRTGVGEPDAGGGLDLTITEQFARSMTLADAMAPGNLLCYEMNDEPLRPEHGSPVRLIAPGWYGVANVKWLARIEVINHRYAGRFMARDYVTFREETDASGNTVWTFENVGLDRLKSAPAKVTRNGGRYRVIGVAWGGSIADVEVSIDGGPWKPAHLSHSDHAEHSSAGLAWRFWTYDWGTPRSGRHTVASRAIDTHGAVQPAPDDPIIADKRTYWESNGQITRTVVIG
jgi:DMSO/TMAO reductase YedYZ molybdopterin-dependent catalytic subunit